MSADAVRDLVRSFDSKINVDECLHTLVYSYFVTYHHERGTYELHPLDQQYAYAQIPDDGEYTKHACHRRAANFYLNAAEQLRAGCLLNQRQTCDMSRQVEWVDTVDRAFAHFLQAEAWQDLVQAHELIKASYVTKFALGLLNHYVGNLSDARSCFQEAIVPDLPPANYRSTVQLGILCREESKAGEAKKYLVYGIDLCSALLKKTPHLYDALYHLALAQLANGQTEEALDTYRKALDVCAAKGVVQSALQDLGLLQRVTPPVAERGISVARKILDVTFQPHHLWL